MLRVFGGAVLIIAGIAGFIEAHSHRPVPATTLSHNLRMAFAEESAGVTPQPASGLSQSNYDLVHIASWALIILGVLLVIVGLIAYARRDARA